MLHRGFAVLSRRYTSLNGDNGSTAAAASVDASRPSVRSGSGRFESESLIDARHAANFVVAANGRPPEADSAGAVRCRGCCAGDRSATPAAAQAGHAASGPGASGPGASGPGAVRPAAPGARAGRAAPLPGQPAGDVRIVAVVNGDVISNVDVDDRARLFALSTGQPLTPDVLDRLRPQIRSQLVDERLRMQEIQRRHIVIQDKQIAAAIARSRPQQPADRARCGQKLAADGIGLRTLVDQIRTQLGWGQVMREQLGTQVDVAPDVIAERQAALRSMTGQPEYRVAEIFIPIDDPAAAADAQRFADTVISELHAGAPFPVVASQFSQSQSALEGGELGWVQANQLDPAVARHRGGDAGRERSATRSRCRAAWSS